MVPCSVALQGSESVLASQTELRPWSRTPKLRGCYCPTALLLVLGTFLRTLPPLSTRTYAAAHDTAVLALMFFGSQMQPPACHPQQLCVRSWRCVMAGWVSAVRLSTRACGVLGSVCRMAAAGSAALGVPHRRRVSWSVRWRRRRNAICIVPQGWYGMVVTWDGSWSQAAASGSNSD